MSPGPEESDDDDPPDIEVQRVQEAAGAALAEANERLVEAELRVQAAQVCFCARVILLDPAVRRHVRYQPMQRACQISRPPSPTGAFHAQSVAVN